MNIIIYVCYMGNRIGYCCISMSINEGKKKKEFVTVNRGMVRKTFDVKGLPYVSELAIENLKDTLKILEYNIKNNIYIYRMSSDVFPWNSEYEFRNLPKFNVIHTYLKLIGKYIKDNNMRCGFHPGPYLVLASENPAVVEKTIKELNKHAELMDLMELEQTTFYPINIHINTTKPTREFDDIKFNIDNIGYITDITNRDKAKNNPSDIENSYLIKYKLNNLDNYCIIYSLQ